MEPSLENVVGVVLEAIVVGCSIAFGSVVDQCVDVLADLLVGGLHHQPSLELTLIVVLEAG